MTLNSERLLLREFVESDWKAVLAYQSNPLYLQYYRWSHRTADDVQSFLQAFIDEQQQQPRNRYQFAVILRAGDELIGSCGIRKSRPGAREAEIGFEFDPAFWGHGYARVGRPPAGVWLRGTPGTSDLGALPGGEPVVVASSRGARDAP